MAYEQWAANAPCLECPHTGGRDVCPCACHNDEAATAATVAGARETSDPLAISRTWPRL